MVEGDIAPVAIGLTVGVLLIVIFTLLSFHPSKSSEVSSGNLETVWVAKNLTQCSEPWQLQHTPIEEYFSLNHISVLGTDTDHWLKPNMFVCESCTCASGTALYVKIPISDLPNIQKLGFFVKAPINE